MATETLSALIVLTIAFSFAAAEDICNQTKYDATNGTINSPNYPLPYPSNVNCSYALVVPEGFALYFRFIEFRTERGGDYLTASCDNATAFGPTTFSAFQYPSTLFISTCRRVDLWFITDSWREATGFSIVYSFVPANTMIEGFKVKPSNLFVTMWASDTARPTFNCTSASGYTPWWVFRDNSGYSRELLTNAFCQVSTTLSVLLTSESIGPGSCNLIATAKALLMYRNTGIFFCNYGTSVSAASLLAPIDPSFEFSKQRGAPVRTITDLGAVKDEEVHYSCSPIIRDMGHPFYRNTPSTWDFHFRDQTSYYFAQFQILRVYWTDETGKEISSNASDRADVSVKAHLLSGVYLFPNYSCNIDLQYFSNVTFLASNVPTTLAFKTGTVRASYGPDEETMSIVGDENGKIIPGGILSCHANSHPAATYQWTDVSTGQLVNGPTISVTHSGQYKCIATNSFGQGHYQADKAITVQVSDDWNRLDKTTLVFVVLFGIVILAMNVVLISFLLWKQWKKRNSVTVSGQRHRLNDVAKQEYEFGDDQRAQLCPQEL